MSCTLLESRDHVKTKGQAVKVAVLEATTLRFSGADPSRHSLPYSSAFMPIGLSNTENKESLISGWSSSCLLCLFDEIHQALKLRFWKRKYLAQFFLGVMVFQQLINIHLGLPTTNYPSAGKHIVLKTAESKIHLAAHPGASNRFVVVLFDQSVYLPWKMMGGTGRNPP